MPKGICIHCNGIFDTSDDVVECMACGAVMKVIGWKPIELELIEPGGVIAKRAVLITQQDLNKYLTGGRRLVAGLIDGIVLMPLALIHNRVFGSNISPTLIIIWSLISFPAVWLYSVLMHGYYGQTLGKMACGVKVLDISEQPITMRQAILRDIPIIVTNTVSLALSLYLVLSGAGIYSPDFSSLYSYIAYADFAWFAAEILTMLTNGKRRAIHDFIAGTVVVRTGNSSRKPEEA